MRSLLGILSQQVSVLPAINNVTRFSAAACILVLSTPPGVGQITSAGPSQAPPVPGANHDYIKQLAETVNPATGSLSVRIDVPTAPGRGFTVPFAFEYDSNSAHHFIGDPYPQGTVDTEWTDNTSAVGGGGWRYAVPELNYEEGSREVGLANEPPPTTCTFVTGFVFFEPASGAHAFPVLRSTNGGNVCNPQYNYTKGVPQDVFFDADSIYEVVLPSRSSNGILFSTGLTPPPATIYGQDGTTYSFSASHYVNASSALPNFISTLPDWVEDANGNRVNYTIGKGGAFTETDTAGRAAVVSSGFGKTGDTVTVAGLPEPYVLTWQPASYNVNLQASYYNDNPPGGSPTSNSTCLSLTTQQSGSQQEVTTLQLPNGTSYQFGYDLNGTGLLNYIAYPSGAVVRYEWTQVPLSSSVAYLADPTVQGADQTHCQALLSTPAIMKRTVSYDGTTIAQEQDYSYSPVQYTQNPNVPGIQRYTSRQTTVTTKDLVRGTSFDTVYQYGAYQEFSIYYQAVPDLEPIEKSVQYKDANGNLLKTVNKVGGIFSQPPSDETTVYPNGQTSTIHRDFGVAAVSNPNQFEFPIHVTDVYQYDFGSSAPGPLLRHDHTDYASFPTTPLGSYIANRPSAAITYDGNGNWQAETDYAYDQSGLAQVANLTGHDETDYPASASAGRGNPTTVTKRCAQPGGAACASPATVFAYDETGQVVSQKDANGNTVQYSYADAYSTDDGSPTATTNALLTKTTEPTVNGVSLTTQYTYGYNDGKLRTETDANGQVTKYCYGVNGCAPGSFDPWLRSTEVDYFDGGKTTASYNDAGPQPSSTASRLLQGSTSESTKTIMDGMGHVIQAQLTSDPAGTDYTDTTYDGLGQVYTVSTPYRSKNDATYGLTTYSYDALGRKTDEIEPTDATAGQGKLHWTYIGSAVQSKNERQFVWQRNYDGLGRLTQVLEPGTNDPSVLPTLESDYFYNALGNLTCVEQHGGSTGAGCSGPASGDAASPWRVRRFSYDALSRLGSEKNPESGTVSYTYDLNGNVQTKTDARGIVTTFHYDALNRITGKSYSNDPSSTPAVAYSYDLPIQGWNFVNQTSPSLSGVHQTFLLGRLSAVQSGQAETVYGYDPLGRTTLKSVCTPTTCGTDHYDMHAAYDLAGNTVFADRGLDAVRNAASPNSGFYYGGLHMIYSGAGQMTDGIADTVDATHPASIVSGVQYSPLGGMTAAAFGGVYSESDQYSPRGWLSSRTGTITATGYARTGTLMHDPAGNVVQQADSLTNSTSTYVQDQLNRLTSASNVFGAAAYGYDAWGNLNNHTNQAGPGYTYSLTMTPQNQVSQTGSTDASFTYDASGNVLTDGLNNYSYDAEGRLHAVNGSTTYSYGPEGERVATLQNNAVTAEYLYGIDGTLTTELAPGGALVRGLVYSGGMHLADYTQDGKTVFHLADEVGSLVNTIDQTGAAIESCAANPFGESLNCSGSGMDFTELHFTDKKRDQESGLDYFGARYYGSTFGRFMSPDDGSDQSAADPQSWNLYAYARNNPLVNTDPSGNDCVLQIAHAEFGGETAYATTTNCDNVRVGDGQSKTQVAGTVTSIRAGADGHSIDIGYTPDAGGAGVLNASAAPRAEFPGLAIGYGNNAQGYQQLAAASRVVNTAGSIELSLLAPGAAALAGCASGGSVAGCGADLALSVLPEVQALRDAATVLRAARGLHAAEISQRIGGFAQALKDFDALPGAETLNVGNLKAKTLADGTKVTVRDFSKAGPPTLQFNLPSGEKIEIRY